MLPDFSFEKRLWSKGFSLVIGVDEVGRGALAGPVVAGACALKFPKYYDIISTAACAIYQFPKNLERDITSLGINDSKKLSAKKREIVREDIKKHFICCVGEAGVGIINSFGIRAATERAMRTAVVCLLYQALDKDNNLTSKIALSQTAIRDLAPYLLLDAFQVKYIPVIGLNHQQAIVKGDEKCISIAAASIVAKVYRDHLMTSLSARYPEYFWQENAGYGTAKHIDALKKHGGTKLHRTRFIDGIINKGQE